MKVVATYFIVVQQVIYRCPSFSHRPLTKYVKLRVAHAPGMPGKRFWHSRRMRNPQFYVSGKRPMTPCPYRQKECVGDVYYHWKLVLLSGQVKKYSVKMTLSSLVIPYFYMSLLQNGISNVLPKCCHPIPILCMTSTLVSMRWCFNSPAPEQNGLPI